jgi:S-adenosyl-L-methionine hydrolase (adenosine-forming)
MQPIALITDFGIADHFLGSMKAAILSVNPKATIIDISHEIPPGDINAAAVMLLLCRKDFPASTIFVAIVDPGVGSSRSAIAIKTGTQFFIGPDNGVLALAIKKTGFPSEIRRLENTRLFRNPISATFHGRDIFGPVAGHLSKGFAFNKLGPVQNTITQGASISVKVDSRKVAGNIIAIDRFGNCITSIEPVHLNKLKAGKLSAVIKGRKRLPVCSSYDDVLEGKPLGIFGSAGFLEISINRGNAARIFRLNRGDIVEIQGE